ncbi:hypothetical protein GALMADRAFT_230640 [Galerina marginata CBS 339.88]|uniref:Uncharacterized protein n=1 Tax=Galerina marginata (strain CBS 339.88) TaxID=685588 RepID=A0A067SNX4_GALM3|nr:hypothetical protein GALMADRAFT_230640 [Galerina marginata CBS 339.88]
MNDLPSTAKHVSSITPGGGNEGFSFSSRDFGPECEFGALLRSCHSPSENQIVELQSIQIHLTPEIRAMEKLKLVKETELQELEKKMSEVSLQIVAAQESSSEFDLTRPHVERSLQLDKALNALLDEISSLKTRCKELYWRTCCASALLAPIRQLPPEIMGEIFLNYMLPHDEMADGRFQFAQMPVQSPLVICQISSAWRSIAMMTPRLWTNLTCPSGRSFKTIARLATLWFGQSGNLPLSLSFICCNSRAGRSEYNRWIGNLDFIWPRLTCLEIRDEGNFAWLLNRVLQSGTSIQKLTIQRVHVEPNDCVTSRFANMPNLRHLTLTPSLGFLEFMNSRYKIVSGFPIKQITSLSLSSFCLQDREWRALMQQCCHNLQHGSFKISHSSAAITRQPMVVARSLVTLRVHFVEYPAREGLNNNPTIVNAPLGNMAFIQPTPVINLPAHHFAFPAIPNPANPPMQTFAPPRAWDIFYDFSFPSLCSLSMDGDEHPLAWNPEPFADLETRGLQALSLSKIAIDPQDLIQFLGDIPNLQSFTADDLRTDYNPLLEQLSVAQNARTFIPKLSSLTIRNMDDYGTKIKKSILHQLLEARSPSDDNPLLGRCLECLAIDPSCFE